MKFRIMFFCIGHINQPKWGHLKRLHENLRKMEKALLYGQMNFTLVNPNINVCIAYFFHFFLILVVDKIIYY